MVSNNGRISLLSSFSSNFAKPLKPEAYTIGKSNCSSDAPNLSNNSNVWSITQLGRAEGLSILLITTIGRKPNAKAFLVTKRVCGIGPSWASTNNTTQSTMPNTRSTSPPKSACPGVSTILM